MLCKSCNNLHICTDHMRINTNICTDFYSMLIIETAGMYETLHKD